VSLEEKLRRPKKTLKITNRKRKLLESYREQEDTTSIKEEKLRSDVLV
jgi:hypothetical protein